MKRFFLFAAMLASPMPLAAQTAAAAEAASARQGETGQPPQRVRSVSLKAGEKCPASSDTEIVVCSTLDEPYRLPKQFRDAGPTAANQSWVNRAATIDQVSRVAGGLPDTCSPVGTGGQSGCALQDFKAYAAERRAKAAEGRSVPGGE